MFKSLEAMGAKLVKQEKIESLMNNDNYVGQLKIDGFRISIEKRDSVVRIFGRGSGKYGSRTEYTDHLPHIVNRLQEMYDSCNILSKRKIALPNNTILDGEIVFLDADGNPDYNKTSSVMGSLPVRAIELQENYGWLYFKIFDVLEYDGRDHISSAYKDRNTLANDVCGCLDYEYIQYVSIVYGINKKILLDNELAMGREGIMLKNLDSKYFPGKKRENTWYKIKAEFDADCVILGYTEPDKYTQVMSNGKKLVDENGVPVMSRNRYFDNGWIGSLIIGQYVHADQLSKEQIKYMSNGTDSIERSDGDISWIDYLVPVGRVSSGLADELRDAISMAREQNIGKIIEIKYFKRTDDSYYLPRFHRFRHEKSMNECIWGE